MFDSLWLDARIATMAEPAGYGVIEDGAIGIEGSDIAWIGPRESLPGSPESIAGRIHSAGGRWITPGLIDCHTHLVFAGDRSRDFEMRLEGADREAIIAAGGGIPYTMAATRAAGEGELLAAAERRLNLLIREGITTIEIKSGYGLDLETELKQLRVARQLERRNAVTIVTTFYGAQNLAPEYRGRSAAYIDFICDTVLPAVKREELADIVDVTYETGVPSVGLSHEDAARLFERAIGMGYPVRAHTDQYGDWGGAAFVAAHGGLSADHLEYTSREGAAKMAEAGTVAVLLPGATYTLHETRRPQVAAFRGLGVDMALATNCNPGSSPTLSLLMMLNMGCNLFGMTTAEALAGVTRNAAKAIGVHDRVGTLEAGKQADFVLWDISRPAELAYWIGNNPCAAVIRAGRKVLETRTR
jgi:imidazolonepropionase